MTFLSDLEPPSGYAAVPAGCLHHGEVDGFIGCKACGRWLLAVFCPSRLMFECYCRDCKLETRTLPHKGDGYDWS